MMTMLMMMMIVIATKQQSIGGGMASEAGFSPSLRPGIYNEEPCTLQHCSATKLLRRCAVALA
eukprot:863838-Karenia_brevis.AAC.1